jgi:hypothetical protein
VSKPVIEICSAQSGPFSNETLALIDDNLTDSNAEVTCQMRVTLAVTFLVGVFQVKIDFIGLLKKG